MSNQFYEYEQYLKDVNFYREKGWEEIRDRNNYVLLGSGGVILFLFNLLDKVKNIYFIYITIWIVMAFFTLGAVFCLISIHIRTKVSSEYQKMYDNLYLEFHSKDISTFMSEMDNFQKKSKPIRILVYIEKIFNIILAMKFLMIFFLTVVIIFNLKNIYSQNGGEITMGQTKIEKSIPPVVPQQVKKPLDESVKPALPKIKE